MKSIRAAVAILLLALVGALLMPAAARPPNDREPKNVGFTFSERQAGYLDVSWRQAFHAAMDLMPNLLRLGAYWDAIEVEPGTYDFSTLDWMVDNTPPQSAILLTVGMKAPRWPEYYIPAWLRKTLPAGETDLGQDERVQAAALRFIAQVVRHYQGRQNVRYWQVENEPLDPAGPHQAHIAPGFLDNEVALVRALDPTRPIVVNMFVDTSPLGVLPPLHDRMRDRAQQLLKVGDILGLDVYPVRPVQIKNVGLSLTWPVWLWEQRVLTLQQLAQSAGKQIWISEAQAEPWLPARLHQTAATPVRNAGPALTASTVDRLQADGFNTILFWGVEYWYMRFQRYKDEAWWSGMRPFFSDAAPSA